MKHASLLSVNANAFLSDNKENLKGIHIALAKVQHSMQKKASSVMVLFSKVSLFYISI